MIDIIGPLKEDVFDSEWDEEVSGDTVYNKEPVDRLIEEYELVIDDLKLQLKQKEEQDV